MRYSLRPYQQEAVDKTLAHFRQTNLPAVIVLPTGAGKSLVIAELARLAKHKILVLAHVKELVEQNAQKYESFGLSASIFSAGLQQKSLDKQVTFASIQSLARNLSLLSDYYSLVIIDECHRVNEEGSGQYWQVINRLKETNPSLKLLGLTATPYRLKEGWIYHSHYHGFVRGNIDAVFKKCIYELPLGYMIKSGYLCPPQIIKPEIEHYDFSALKPNSDGNYNESELNTLLSQQTRATFSIVQNIVALSHARQGAMIFAATVAHAKEIVSYLNSTETALITGETIKSVRNDLINQFKAKKLKYLVNVSVLTTGFDAPHVDLIAILRPTESVSLYQQIAGRGLRLSPGKTDCLLIDYAGNRFDLFYPEVGSVRPAPDTEPVQVLCPGCGFANTFWGRIDENGNVTEHFGRRCKGLLEDDERSEQCDYRFRFKECSHCGAENDIAARQCHGCQAMLVDPDDKLRDALNLKNAKVIRCAGLSIELLVKQIIEVTYHDEEGETLSEKYDFSKSPSKAAFLGLYLKRLQTLNPQCKLDTVDDVLAHYTRLIAPDFVIAHHHKRFGWQITDKIFDYQGRFRKANSL